MISLVYYGIIAACILVLTAILFQKISRMDKKKSIPEKAISMEEYLFKIARITGHSEYDVFCKSA
jgi:hypothetical protein